MHQIDHATSHLPCRSRDKHPDQMPSSSRFQSPLRRYQLRGAFTGSLLPYRLGWAFASTATDTALQQEPQYHHTPYPHAALPIGCARLAVARASGMPHTSSKVFRTSTSRGLMPSAGPTMPSFSIISIIRAARL